MVEQKAHLPHSELFRELLHATFQAALLSYLLYYLIETFSPSFISRFYSLGDHLWVVVIIGLLAAVYPLKKSAADVKPMTIRQLIFLGLVAIVAGALLFVKIKALGWLAFVVVPLIMLIILGISLSIIRHGDDQT